MPPSSAGEWSTQKHYTEQMDTYQIHLMHQPVRTKSGLQCLSTFPTTSQTTDMSVDYNLTCMYYIRQTGRSKMFRGDQALELVYSEHHLHFSHISSRVSEHRYGCTKHDILAWSQMGAGCVSTSTHIWLMGLPMIHLFAIQHKTCCPQFSSRMGWRCGSPGDAFLIT